MATVKLIIEATTAQAQKAIKNLQTVGLKSVGSLEKITSRLNTAFSSMAASVGGLIAAYAGFSGLKAAITQIGNFSKAIQEIKSIADENIRTNENLGKSLIETARTFGTASTDQAKIFYQILSAGITEAERAQRTLIAANKLAIGGLASTESAVDILTSALNVYAEENLDAEVAADALFTAVRLGKTRVEDLASSLGKVLPIAKSVGLGFDTVSAAVAALTTKGLGTSEAVTALNSLLTGIVKNQDRIKKAGGEISEAFSLAALKSKPFNQFIDDLSKSVGGSAGEILNLIGRKEGLLAVQGLASESTRVLTANMDAMTKSAGAADRAFADVEASIGFQVDKIRANLGNLVLAFTTKGEDEFTSVLETVNKAIEATSKAMQDADFSGISKSLKLISKVLFLVVLSIDDLITKIGRVADKIFVLDDSLEKSEKSTISWSNVIKKSAQSVASLTLGLPSATKGLLDFFLEPTKAAKNTEKQINAVTKNMGALDRAIVETASADTILGKVALAIFDIGESAKDAEKPVKEIAVTLEEFMKSGGFVGPLLPDESVFDSLKRNILSTFQPIGLQIENFIKPAAASFERIINKFRAGDYAGIFDGAGEFFSGIGTAVKDAVMAAGPIIKDALVIGAKVFEGIFGGKYIEYFINGLEAFAGLPEQFLKLIEKLDVILSKLIEGLEKVILKLPSIFSKVINRFIGDLPLLVDLLGAALLKIADLIADSIDDVIAAILRATVDIVNKLPAIVDKLAEALAPALRAFLAGLPDVIDAIFNNLPSIVKSIADEIGPLMEVIADKIGPVVDALVEGVVGSAGEIIEALIDSLLIEGGLERIIVALIKAVPRIVVALVAGLGRGLVRAGDAIGRSISRGFGVGSANIGRTIGNAVGLQAAASLSTVQLPQLTVKKPSWKVKVDKISAVKVKFPKPDWLQSFQDALNNFGPGGGGGDGGGPVTGIQGSPIATGGIIPKGFLNDSYPAALTSGELVTPVKTTDNLFSLIDNLADKLNRDKETGERGQTSQNLNISLNIGESELANVLLNLNRQGFRVA